MLGRLDEALPKPNRPGILSNLLDHFTRDVVAIRNSYVLEDSESLERRRKIVKLAAFATINASVIALHQSGILKSLPDLQFKIFDAGAVTRSPKAYEFGLPDGSLAATLNSLIMVLATYGGTEELRRSPKLNTLLLAATIGNSLAGIQYFLNMLFKQKKICLYCVSAATLNVMMLSPAVKEWSSNKA